MLTDTTVVPGALTIAVTSGKGGVGKTTTAVALAAALTARGKDVVVIDGDLYGPNVHLVADVTDLALAAHGEPLSLTLPTSPLGFRVITPASVDDDRASAHMRDLFAMAQFAEATDIVIVDMPPGWTDQHTDVCNLLPDVIVAVVAPTATSLADHERHTAAWTAAWAGTVRKRREADKRRKLTLQESPTLLTVETMARFTGVPDVGGAPVTVRRIDALPADQVAQRAAPVASIPAAADAGQAAATAELGVLVDAILAAVADEDGTTDV